MNYTLRNLLIAAVLGFVGLVLTTSYIKGQRAEISRGRDEVKVLIAKKDIPAGTPAKTLEQGGYVEVDQMLREDAPPGTLHDAKEVKDLALEETVYQGEVLTQHKFEATSGLNPTEQIKGTERMVSLPIMPTGTVAGMVRPGDHVDIYATGKGGLSKAQVKKIDKESDPQYWTPDAFTWAVARDVVVVQTPASLLPKGTEVKPEPVKVKADPELYVIKASDDVIQDLLYAYGNSQDDTHLMMLLRPSDGAQETETPPQVIVPNQN